MSKARSAALIWIIAAILVVVAVQGFSQSESGNASVDQQPGLSVGDILQPEVVHIIDEPGIYGLGRKVGTSEYAVAKGHLIRIDPITRQVLSILRIQDDILD